MSVLYFAGAETGDTSELSAIAGIVTVSSSIVHTGAYSYMVNGSSTNSGATLTTGLNASPCYFRCWVNISAVPSPATIVIIQIRDSTETLLGKIFLDTTGLLGAQATGGTIIGGTHVLGYNIWYLLECRYVAGTGANAVLECRLGGTVEATCSNGTSTTNADNFIVAAGSNMITYLDDVCIRNDRYPGDGRCLARQGTPGAPTYTAWTETGGAIYVVWSNTPYNATAFAAATSQNQEQSMLTASFSRGGIGPFDTVNSVKVGAVGNLSATGATNHKLLLRYGGTDYLSANLAGLTTATSYGEFYPSPLPTLAQLNASEAGGNQGANSTALWTIDDLWVMVDFTPVWFDEMPTNTPIFESLGVTSYG